MEQPRVVVWFSCGAPSAVTARLALQQWPLADVKIVYCEVKNEHPDNERFLKDCESWLGRHITRIRSERYADCWQVWEERRFLVSPKGALCTTEMKKIPRQEFQEDSDLQMFGYTVEEQNRAQLFRENNPEINLATPLIDAGLTKADCKGIIKNAGIELPMMYRLGYHNNNCIGCVKGGAGYWNKIRVDFPEVFDRMAKLERTIGATLLKVGGERIYLDELPVSAGRYIEEPNIECSLLCQIVQQDFQENHHDQN